MKVININGKNVCISDKLYAEIKKLDRKEERLDEKIATFERKTDKDVSSLAISQEENFLCELEERNTVRILYEIIHNDLSSYEKYLVAEVIIKGRTLKDVSAECGMPYKRMSKILKFSVRKIRKIYNRKINNH